MKISNTTFFKALCIIFLFSAFSFNAEATPPALSSKPAAKFIVYYFHTTMRCPSCHKIEKFTHEAMLSNFSEDLKKGGMEWRMVNVDEKTNKHFINEYKLYTKTVIVSRVENGKETAWKNLDQVWMLLGDEGGFKEYIRNEITSFIKGKNE